MFALMTANSLTFHDGACTIDVYVVTHVPMPDTMVLDPRIMVTSMFAAAGIPVRVNMRRPARGDSVSLSSMSQANVAAKPRRPRPLRRARQVGELARPFEVIARGKLHEAGDTRLRLAHLAA